MVWVLERRVLLGVLLGVLLEVLRVSPKVPRMPPELPRVLLRDRCLRSAAVRLEPLELPQRGLPVEAAHLPRSAAAAARLRCSAATALLPSSRALRAAAVECHQALRVQLGSPRAAGRTATLLW